MPESRYKYVAKRARNDKPWQAIARGQYVGAFADEEQAAEAVAEKLGQPKASFLRTPAPGAIGKAPQRTHRYVYWHSTHQAWQVKRLVFLFLAYSSIMRTRS